ncbi:MAG: 2'-5' RNA ligase family protein [Bacillota bacterium]|nr:2'-5' RNA ligase family protein [Bacillota bacterium]
MNYYLVALLDEDSYENIEFLQKNISKKYRIYKELPKLHITLEVIKDPDIEMLSKTVNDIIGKYKKFKAEVNGTVCFQPPYKSVNLLVEKKGYIGRLSRVINEKLRNQGFQVRDDEENWDLHISLANTNFAKKEWSIEEYSIACERSIKEDYHRMIRIEKIEIWKPINVRKDMIIKSFELK